MGPQALGSAYNGLMKPDTDIIIRNTTAKSQLTVDTFSHRINVIRSHSLAVHWEVVFKSKSPRFLHTSSGTLLEMQGLFFGHVGSPQILSFQKWHFLSSSL